MRMPNECTLVCALHRIPQMDSLVPTSTCERTSIRAERDAIHISRMPREQGNFGAGVCTIEPNTDPTCDRETATGFFTQVALG
jgi:hypothetical protein